MCSLFLHRLESVGTLLLRKLCVLCSHIGLSRHPTIEEVVCSLFLHRLESVGTLLLRKLCVLCSYIGLSQ